MNYRHAFHAGNFADVFKHAVLALIIAYLKEKPGAFRILDTHAGSGLYDLGGPEAHGRANGAQGLPALAPHSTPLGRAFSPFLKIVQIISRRKDSHLSVSPVLALALLREQEGDTCA